MSTTHGHQKYKINGQKEKMKREKVAKICDSVNPLWLWLYELPLVFHAANTMCCGVAAIVLSLWQRSFFDQLCCINGYT